MKRIEIRNKKNERLMATYCWESRTFEYDPAFFERLGDWFFVTDGDVKMTFPSIPPFFFEHLPDPGTEPFHFACRRLNLTPDDDFEFITKVGANIVTASFYFKGVDE